jgi:cobalt-zinc-cadmium efflux system outer membrane protein
VGLPPGVWGDREDIVLRQCSILVVVLLLGSIFGQDRLAQAQGSKGKVTVDALVAHALAHNPDLQATRAGVEVAQGRLRQAGLRPNPMLDLGVQESVTGPDNNIMASLTLPLDLNGRKAGRVGVAAHELELKRAQVAERERQLRAEVRMKAGELLATRRNLRFTQELLRVNRDALGLLRARVARGAAPPLEANLLLVEVNHLDTSYHLLQSQVDVLTLQLKILVGFSPEAPLVLQGELHPAPLGLDRQEGLKQALAARSDLIAAQAEMAMAEASIEKERAEGRWDASVNVGYMRQDMGFHLLGLTEQGETQPIEGIFHYIGGGVTIMLPLRNRNQGNIAAAMAETTAAQRRLAFALLTVRQEVAAAFVRYEATKRALEIYAQGVREVARQNLEVVRKTYALGRTSLLDLIAEQRRYINIETGYTDALKQVHDAAVEIERAVGTTER